MCFRGLEEMHMPSVREDDQMDVGDVSLQDSASRRRQHDISLAIRNKCRRLNVLQLIEGVRAESNITRSPTTATSVPSLVKYSSLCSTNARELSPGTHSRAPAWLSRESGTDRTCPINCAACDSDQNLVPFMVLRDPVSKRLSCDQ